MIRRLVGHREATRFLVALRQSTRVLKVYSDAALDQTAEAVLARYVDHDFSLTDAVSFVGMRERRIQEAFGFDRHFLTAGFILVPLM